MTDYTPQDLEELFGADPKIMEHEGISVGDSVVAVEDDSQEEFFEGSNGIVLGFIKMAPAKNPELAARMGGTPEGGTFPLVEFDGYDPVMVRDITSIEIQ